MLSNFIYPTYASLQYPPLSQITWWDTGVSLMIIGIAGMAAGIFGYLLSLDD